MEKKKYTTGFLFSNPNLITGAGTVINLAGNYYEFNASENGEEADRIAIEHDFRMVGQDISDAIDIVYNDYP